MTILTASDYADTGQWRLIVRIYSDGMSAHLENSLHDDVEPQELFTTHWDNDPQHLLAHIENAVYDHPRVLDDFSARIEIYDRRVMFVPSHLLAETEGSEETFYTSLYGGDGKEVMCDTDKDVTALYSPCDGLKSFLSRTFPGARVGCNLMHRVSYLRNKGEGMRLYVNLRKKEADYILLQERDLLSASTRDWENGADISYHAFNLFKVYGVDPKEVKIEADGEDLPSDAAALFSKNTKE